jgi:hypothetical protein
LIESRNRITLLLKEVAEEAEDVVALQDSSALDLMITDLT